ncbi:hypothetical protein ANTPLA_LOCUS1798 [Anthophora plagiata]
MAVNRLCSAFRQITINKQSNIIGRYYSSNILKGQTNDLLSHNYSKNVSHSGQPEVHVKFISRTLNIDFGNPDSTVKNYINEMPLSKYIPSMEEPLIQKPVQQDLPLTDKSFELPPTANNFEKLAFVWAKIRAKRNSLKEKNFQAELIAKIKEAQLFDAKKHVEERLALLDKEFVPKTYKGEIIPEQMIKEFLKKDQERINKKINKPRLKLD